MGYNIYMKTIPENTDKQRKCYKCNEIKPLTTEYFYKEKSRTYGFAFLCKVCDKAKGRKWHPYRSFSPEQKERKRETGRKYSQTQKGKVVRVMGSCKSYDRKKGYECDLDFDFVAELINKPCIYCNDTEEVIGCDRIDNSKGHLKSNVVPCCVTCNITRFHNFTFEEMLQLGKCVAKIKKQRKKRTKELKPSGRNLLDKHSGEIL